MRNLWMMLWLLGSASVWADDTEIAVVANGSGEYANVTRKQVVDIYMGKLTVLNNGTFPIPLDYADNPPIRERFYKLLTGKSQAQINAYWARMSFTGQTNPARLLSNEQIMLRAVSKNADAIGYVEKSNVPTSLHVVLTLE